MDVGHWLRGGDLSRDVGRTELPTQRRRQSIEPTLVSSSGVDTGGSGGSMNRSPRAPGGPSAEPQKIYARK